MLMFSDTTIYWHACEQDTFTEEDIWYQESNAGGTPDWLIVYPNPGDDEVTAEADASIEGEREIYLYDGYGHLLDTWPIPPASADVKMDISGYAQGVYIVILYADAQYVQSKLLIIQRP
jgi:hypothetical protein